MSQHLIETVKTVTDGTSVVMAVGALLNIINGILAAVASILAIAWSIYRFMQVFKGRKTNGPNSTKETTNDS